MPVGWQVGWQLMGALGTGVPSLHGPHPNMRIDLALPGTAWLPRITTVQGQAPNF